MTALPRPRMHDVRGKMRKTIDAHKAITDKIAEHAAEAIAARDVKLTELETANTLNGVMKP